MCTVAGIRAFMSMPCVPGRLEKNLGIILISHVVWGVCCACSHMCNFAEYEHLWACHVVLGRLENNLRTALIFCLIWGRLSWYLALHMPGKVAWKFPGILWFLHLISLQVPGNCRQVLYTTLHGFLGSQASCLQSNYLFTEPSAARHYPLSRLSIPSLNLTNFMNTWRFRLCEE